MSKRYKKSLHGGRNVMDSKHDKVVDLSGNQKSQQENSLPNGQKFK